MHMGRGTIKSGITISIAETVTFDIYEVFSSANLWYLGYHL